MSLLGTFGTLSVIYLFYILLKLSKRLGSVEKMTPIYRYYYVAIFFLSVGYITQVAVSLPTETVPNWVYSSWVLWFGYYLPMTIAVTLGLFATWRYWSWLIAPGLQK